MIKTVYIIKAGSIKNIYGLFTKKFFMRLPPFTIVFGKNRTRNSYVLPNGKIERKTIRIKTAFSQPSDEKMQSPSAK